PPLIQIDTQQLPSTGSGWLASGGSKCHHSVGIHRAAANGPGRGDDLASGEGNAGRAIGSIGSNGQDMTGQGHQTFADELARFAAGRADPRVTAIAERAAAPLRAAV